MRLSARATDRLLSLWMLTSLVGSIALWAWLFPAPGAWHWLLSLPAWGLVFWWPLIAYLRHRSRLTQLGETFAP
jgi:hypothetical protein